jgi:ribosomal-protein-alanine N-acetyltransferase
VPLLVEPALPNGTLRGIQQPRLQVDAELVLRPWRRGDAREVRAAFDCAEIQRWHVRRLDDEDEAREWTAQWVERWKAENAASWAVVDGADEVLGQVGLRNVSLAEGSAGLSYWVTPAARGRGVAARAVQAMTGWAFGTIRFNRLGIQHSTANVASCRVAARTGFLPEGTLRQAIKHADGWHDWHIHGRLHSDI